MLFLLLCCDLVQSSTVNGMPALSTGVVVTLGLVSHLQQHPQPAGDVAPADTFPGDGEVLHLACQTDPQAGSDTSRPSKGWTIAVLTAETSL